MQLMPVCRCSTVIVQNMSALLATAAQCLMLDLWGQPAFSAALFVFELGRCCVEERQLPLQAVYTGSKLHMLVAEGGSQQEPPAAARRRAANACAISL